MALGAVKLQRGGREPEVNVCVTGLVQDPLLEVGGPILHWIGPETLVDLTIEGRNVNALADSGSQVNTITPTFVQQYGFPVLPLEDLVDHQLNLVGLGRKCTSPLGFVILGVQVWEITGNDEDIVFLVVPEGPLGHRNLYDWPDNQLHLGKQDRLSLDTLGHGKGGAATLLSEKHSCPCSGECRDPD